MGLAIEQNHYRMFRDVGSRAPKRRRHLVAARPGGRVGSQARARRGTRQLGAAAAASDAAARARRRTRAKARAETLALGEKARFEEADATALPFDDGSFDVVVDTFSLCVIVDPSAALREVRRVLRSKGRAVLIEHSKSDVGALGAYQDLTSAPVKRMSKGCVWNQDVESLVRQSGMRVVKTQRALLGLLVVVEAAP